MTTPLPSPAELEQSYKAAEYRVGHALAVKLAIGQPCPPLDAMLRQYGAENAALLTAANPGSRLREASANDEALRELQEQLTRASIPMLPACGRDPLGAWPDEPGVLALGITLANATTLAATFGQLAFVWCATSEAPCLIWVSHPKEPPAAPASRR